MIGVGLWVMVKVLNGYRDCDGGDGALCVLGVYWRASFRCGHSLVMVTAANLLNNKTDRNFVSATQGLDYNE